MSHQPELHGRAARKRHSHNQPTQSNPPVKQPKLQESETLEGSSNSNANTSSSGHGSVRWRKNKHQGLSIDKPASHTSGASGAANSAGATSKRSSVRRRRASHHDQSSAAPSSLAAAATSPSETSSTEGAGSQGNLKDRISNLCDYFPEVSVPNFKRITRSFTKRIGASSRGGSHDDQGASVTKDADCAFDSRSEGHPASVAVDPVSEQTDKKLAKSSHDLASVGTTGACGSISSVTAALPSLRGTGRNSVAPTGKGASSAEKGGIGFTPGSTAAVDLARSNSNDPTNRSSAESTTGMSSSADAAGRDSLEVGRLQALLEASGLSGHFFSAIAPRMHGILHRGSGGSGGMGGGGSSSTNSKVQSLLAGMQQVGDESTQLQSVMEMCQLLLLGNEDSLGSAFPIKQLVQVLMQLLTLEDNFDIMTHACRALTYAMEALPRSTTVVCDALPLLLAKLQRIECMDVAEQALTAVEMLSRRHSKTILCAGGISACLQYVDFFSLSAQRNALITTANCCYHMIGEEFKFVANSLPVLTQRLAIHDKKSVESVCLCFTRLVDSFQTDPVRLETIASSEFLKNILQLLVISPPILTTQSFISVIRMLYQMCAINTLLAVKLVKHNIGETLKFLLLGSSGGNGGVDIELVARSPQELHEMVCLIGEIMPRLPVDGIFSVDTLLRRSYGTGPQDVIWQWKDDTSTWRPYSATDCRILETAFQAREDEVTLNGLGCTYTVDFHNMIQINEESGNSRPVQRKTVTASGAFGGRSASLPPAFQNHFASPSTPVQFGPDARLTLLETEPEVLQKFVQLQFPILYEIYVNAAGPSIRHECLTAVRRMVYHSTPEVLGELLKDLTVSSHIANMLDSQDLKLVVGAVQLVHVLLQKLPDQFTLQFRREGVLHQIEKLAAQALTATSAATSASKTHPATSAWDTFMGSVTSVASMATDESASVGVVSGPMLWPPADDPSRMYQVAVAGHPVPPRGPPPVPFDINYLQHSQSHPATTVGKSDPAASLFVAPPGITTEPTTPAPQPVSTMPPPLAGYYAAADMHAGLNILSLPSGPGDLGAPTLNSPPAYNLFRWVSPHVPLLPSNYDPLVPPPPPTYTGSGSSSKPATNTGSAKGGSSGSRKGFSASPAATMYEYPPPTFSVGAFSAQNAVPSALTPSGKTEATKSASSTVTPPAAQGLTASAPALKKEKRRDKDSFVSRRKRSEDGGSKHSVSGSASAMTESYTGGSTREKVSKSDHRGSSDHNHNRKGRSSGSKHSHSSRHSGSSHHASSGSSNIFMSMSSHARSLNSGGSQASYVSAPANPSGGGQQSQRGFLSSLPFPKWGRGHSGTSASAGSTPVGVVGSGRASDPAFRMETGFGSGAALERAASYNPGCAHSSFIYSSSMASAQNDANRQKIREWIKTQSDSILASYFKTHDGKNHDDVLSVLKKVTSDLENEKESLAALNKLRSVLDEDAVSPFEILHSGLVDGLLTYLTGLTGENGEESRNNRLKMFCSTFLNLIETDRGPMFNLEANKIPLLSLVVKVNACLTQIEQFPVKVHDVPSSGSGHLRGMYALKFFHTHQLKC